jgi:hypothetical protein
MDDGPEVVVDPSLHDAPRAALGGGQRGCDGVRTSASHLEQRRRQAVRAGWGRVGAIE